MENVIELRPVECDPGDFRQRRGDPHSLSAAQLEREMGGQMEDLAAQLSCLSRSYRAGRLEEVMTASRAAAVMATSLRLDRLARVARTVCVLAGQDDAAALAANLARMLRLGEAALRSMWDMQDTLA